MFLESLQRHLAVCAQCDLPTVAKMDPGFWNVISIREPERPRIQTHGFRQIHTVICYDVVGFEGLERQIGVPRREQMEEIFRFVDVIPSEPILVHCWAGISRSTAVALAIIVREMHYDGFKRSEIVQQSPEILLQIRPKAAPNPLMLELGLSLFLPSDDAQKLMKDLVNHPHLYRNRMKADPL